MTSYDAELNRLAYAEVVIEEYPAPIPTKDDEIAAKRDEWQRFHEGTLSGIPEDPYAKMAMHDRIGTELEALIAENELIRENNAETRIDIDADHARDIAAFKIVPANTHRAAVLALAKEYNPQLATLAQAYMAAMILGDETTMVENRAAYQVLLDEYNTALGEIP